MKVNEPTKAVQAMREAAKTGKTLMGGTKAMRQAGTAYLPKFPAESQEAYDARLGQSFLFNAFRKTVNDMTGRVFEKPVKAGDELPPEIVEMLENVDLAGNDLSVFSREVFEDGLSGAGISWIMVDAPPRNGVVTRGEAQALNLRPYLVHIKLDEMLGWKAEPINNAMTLTQVRLAETVTIPDGQFGEKTIPQVRVIDRLENAVTVTLWQEVDTGGKKDWVIVQEPIVTGLSEITLVPVYLRRKGFMAGEPVLDDLADLNVAHWQSQSDQRNILHVARVPILFGAGMPEGQTVTISTSQATFASDPAAKLQWVEHSGASIGAGRQDLLDLEFKMEAFGLSLIAKQVNQSATGAANDAKKETSQLSMMADALQDALENAVYFMCDYAGLPRTGSVEVNKDFTIAPITAQEVAVLLQAVNTGQLSRETFLRELVARGVIPEIDPLDEAERIASEGGGIVTG